MALSFHATLGLNSCSKDSDDDGPGGISSSECTFKVTIDEITTYPNEFGQDMVALIGNDGNGSFAFQIVQSKGGASNESLALTTFIKENLDRDLPLGEYPVHIFNSSDFSTTNTEMLPLYTGGDAETVEVINDMVFTLLENSDKRMRMKVSGLAMKSDMVDGVMVELGLVPLEAEISMATDLLKETVVDGITGFSGICKCQNQ